MVDIRNKKYLVVVGCSQTYGQICHVDETWATKLAKKLGLELINLAVSGTGWYHIEAITTQFINYNQDKVKDCFFILQKSMLERRLNYQELPYIESDIFEKWNINFITGMVLSARGYNNWDRFGKLNLKPNDWEENKIHQYIGCWMDEGDIDPEFRFFPEHRHYPESRHSWMLPIEGTEDQMMPPRMDERFEELMLHWAQRMYSFHTFLNSLNVDHIMFDGYTPCLSYKLNFRDYYNNEDEFQFIKEFWSMKDMEDYDAGSDKPDDVVKLYDFKNIKSGWLFDKIDIKNKIDDVVVWSLYQYHLEPQVNADGGHAGPIGMDRIFDVIYLNLIDKGWVTDDNFIPTFDLNNVKEE